MANNARWFIVHTYSGYEKKVCENLTRQINASTSLQNEIFEVTFPTKKVKEVKSGAVDDTKKKKASSEPKEVPAFPCYVFVLAKTYIKYDTPNSNMPITLEEKNKLSIEEQANYREVVALDNDAWYKIRNTQGVTGFVGPDSKPQALSAEEVLNLGLTPYEESHSAEDIDDDEMFNFGDDTEIKSDVNVGDTVVIISGPYKDMTGTVTAIDFEHDSVTVDIIQFNRNTQIDFGFAELMPAD